ncbi:MAG TPA: hypothetical protein VFF16_14730 [Telluria sp.]|nr:hypothetical protein [Telluria sp.]
MEHTAVSNRAFRAAFRIVPFLLCASLAAPAGATEDTDTPGAGHWENNLGWSATRQQGAWRYGAPEAELNYGAGDRTQWLLGLPYVRVRDADGAKAAGPGDIVAGVKWRLVDETEHAPALAVFPQLSWNARASTAARRLEEPGYKLALPLIAGWRRGATGFYVEGGASVSEKAPTEWQAGVKILHQCLARLECRVELEHARVPRDGGQTTLQFGGKLTLREGVILNVSLGRDTGGAQAGRRDLVTYVGLQFLR